MIEKKFFVINFKTKKDSKLLKVPFSFEEAPNILNEFLDSIKKNGCDYWINHKLVFHNDVFIHQFDIFENFESEEYKSIITYGEFKNAKSTK